jgi:hypothetical protein
MLQNLRKTVELYESQLNISNTRTKQFDVLKGLPFYNWQDLQDTRTFNHVIGLPQKKGKSYSLFDYEEMLFNEL